MRGDRDVDQLVNEIRDRRELLPFDRPRGVESCAARDDSTPVRKLRDENDETTERQGVIGEAYSVVLCEIGLDGAGIGEEDAAEADDSGRLTP